MSNLYAMRRANGDWFALDDHGRFRVPVFRSSWEGMLASIRHAGMMLFSPTVLDGSALVDFLDAGDGGGVNFWLVDSPFTSLDRGSSLNREQFLQLTQGGGSMEAVKARGVK